MKLVRWYYDLHSIFKALINSLFAAIGFFCSAIIPNELVTTLGLLNPLQKTLVYIGAFALVFAVYSITFIFFRTTKEKMELEEKEENEIILLAYTKCDRIITDEMKNYCEDNTIAELIIGKPLHTIQKIVSAAYETLDDFYGKSVNPNDRIKFEATFMTKSYIDNEITIPAYQNKENRAPRSLQQRKDNPKVYDDTITARVYREPRPSIHIIEDTTDPKSEYQELYPSQQRRIQSTVVFPVLSNENLLLGTLVIHCDNKGFFRLDKTKFLSELLEIFAKRLASEKLYLDKIVTESGNINVDTSDFKNIF